MWQWVAAEGRKKHECLYQKGQQHGSFHTQAFRLLPCRLPTYVESAGCSLYWYGWWTTMHVYLVRRSDNRTLVGRHVAFGHSCYLIPGLGWGGADWRWPSTLTIRDGVANGDCYRWLLELCGKPARTQRVVSLGRHCSHGRSVGGEPRGHRCGRRWPDDGDWGVCPLSRQQHPLASGPTARRGFTYRNN